MERIQVVFKYLSSLFSPLHLIVIIYCIAFPLYTIKLKLCYHLTNKWFKFTHNHFGLHYTLLVMKFTESRHMSSKVFVTFHPNF